MPATTMTQAPHSATANGSSLLTAGFASLGLAWSKMTAATTNTTTQQQAPTGGGAVVGKASSTEASTQAAAMGRYELSSRLLGEGGYAKVVLGRCKSTDERVAVKLLSGNATGRRAGSSDASVVREVAAMRRACTQRHPNVCHFFDYYRVAATGDGGITHAIVLEMCGHGELFKLVERHGAIPEAAVRPLFAGVVAGVAHLHASGVAHRDIKLENILLGGPDGKTPKVADLGLAHAYARDGEGWADSKLLTSFCGSRSYCAPEVMAGHGYNGFVADVWSLGVCLFGLVSGFFPVEEASARDWRYERLARLQHLEPTKSSCEAIYGFYNRPCPLSASAVALLDGMLQVQPSCRASLSDVASSAWLRGEAPPTPSAAVTATAATAAEALAPRSPPPPQPLPSNLDAPVEVVIDRGDMGAMRAEAALSPMARDEVDVTDAIYRSLSGGTSGSAAHGGDGASAICPPPLTRQRAHSHVSQVCAQQSKRDANY